MTFTLYLVNSLSVFVRRKSTVPDLLRGPGISSFKYKLNLIYCDFFTLLYDKMVTKYFIFKCINIFRKTD